MLRKTDNTCTKKYICHQATQINFSLPYGKSNIRQNMPERIHSDINIKVPDHDVIKVEKHKIKFHAFT